VTPGERLLSRLRMTEGRIEYLTEQLVIQAERCSDYKRQKESLASTLKRCRESRDGWKAKAIAYRKRAYHDRIRARYWQEQRDLWKFRALRAEVELHPTPNGKNHLARVSKAA
jgi:hypothetical protein